MSLTDKQIHAGWEQTFSTNNPYCPCDLKSFTKAVNWTQRALATQAVPSPAPSLPARLTHAMQHADVASSLLMDAHTKAPDTWRGWYDDALNHIDIVRNDLEVLAARSTVAAPVAQPEPATLSQAALDVLAERLRQIESEGWTPEHDDEHSGGELALAAASYALEAAALEDNMRPSDTRGPPFAWPWERSWWKPSHTARPNLIKAGALVLAEIERLDRAAAPSQPEPTAGSQP